VVISGRWCRIPYGTGASRKQQRPEGGGLWPAAGQGLGASCGQRSSTWVCPSLIRSSLDAGNGRTGGGVRSVGAPDPRPRAWWCSAGVLRAVVRGRHVNSVRPAVGARVVAGSHRATSRRSIHTARRHGKARARTWRGHVRRNRVSSGPGGPRHGLLPPPAACHAGDRCGCVFLPVRNCTCQQVICMSIISTLKRLKLPEKIGTTFLAPPLRASAPPIAATSLLLR
jgi:hypothetical protein